MKVSELLSSVAFQPVPKGRNLAQVGWAHGYLVVRFRGRSDVMWIYGPEIEEKRRDQLLANPFPDSLFQKAIKAKYRAYKVGHAA